MKIICIYDMINGGTKWRLWLADGCCPQDSQSQRRSVASHSVNFSQQRGYPSAAAAESRLQKSNGGGSKGTQSDGTVCVDIGTGGGDRGAGGGLAGVVGGLDGRDCGKGENDFRELHCECGLVVN